MSEILERTKRELGGHGMSTTVYQKMNRIQTFLKTCNCEPDSYFTTGRNYSQDIKDFFMSYVRENCRPQSIGSYKTALRDFFKINNPDFFWGTKYTDFRPTMEDLRRINTVKHGRVADRIPTHEEFKKILFHHTRNIRERALYLIRLSSGIRNCEISVLPLDAIVGRQINVPDYNKYGEKVAKSMETRVTFMSTEAHSCYLTYLESREEITKKIQSTAVSRLPEEVKEKEWYYVFPHLHSNSQNWNTLLKRAKLNRKTTQDVTSGVRYKNDGTRRNENTTRHVFHQNTLRKFFITHAKSPNPDGSAVNTSYVYALAGQEAGIGFVGEHLSGHYNRFEPTVLKEYYDRCIMPKVLITERPAPRDLKFEELQKELVNVKKNLHSTKATMILQELSLAHLNFDGVDPMSTKKFWEEFKSKMEEEGETLTEEDIKEVSDMLKRKKTIEKIAGQMMGQLGGI